MLDSACFFLVYCGTTCRLLSDGFGVRACVKVPGKVGANSNLSSVQTMWNMRVQLRCLMNSSGRVGWSKCASLQFLWLKKDLQCAESSARLGGHVLGFQCVAPASGDRPCCICATDQLRSSAPARQP